MKVLVLGANGFIGARLVDRLIDSGHDVKVLTRSQGKHKNINTEIFIGDLRDPLLDTSRLLEGCEVVFNCAGEIRNDALMHELHVVATNRMLEAVSKKVAENNSVHWVQLSSVGAYGSVPDVERIVTEETKVSPRGEYEVTKTVADQNILTKSKESAFTFSILRPSNVFGPGMPNNSVRQLIAIVRRRLFFYVGFNEPIVTYVHVDDVVSALLLCGFDKRAEGEIFNISNDCSLRELIEGIARSISVPAPFLRIPKFLIRSAVSILSIFTKGMITQERVNALTSRTRYPTTKLKQKLDFEPKKYVPDYIAKI
ncbi:nucleoside-diphosphate sugar epimerase [Pseudomonas prosekii]|uniref:NAD-dependent epimerase/dehydratase family protein n=1 Tax=Pseudomonas prosekii TaxID=1148509 RepID=UPI000D606BA2|nr:NAD(P)-dependent oxidoreductase [Pseudomonas prosekii]PWE44716.1 nucleoside-diphosphate sugar epimerase [Pseudomonas prosekii]